MPGCYIGVVPHATAPLPIHDRDLRAGDPVVLVQGLGARLVTQSDD
ncbi:MAG: hypothetical protein JNL38_05710 [Myxococcales bacterium]|jgi:hypothetical protein|nr:hypothetical protein [Myxococcales bacterium]